VRTGIATETERVTFELFKPVLFLALTTGRIIPAAVSSGFTETVFVKLPLTLAAYFHSRIVSH
jgi:hypothetical protein